MPILQVQQRSATERSSQLAEQGDVDGSMVCVQQAEAFQAQHDALQKQLTQPERIMTVCEVCGVFINSTDNEQRRQVGPTLGVRTWGVPVLMGTASCLRCAWGSLPGACLVHSRAACHLHCACALSLPGVCALLASAACLLCLHCACVPCPASAICCTFCITISAVSTLCPAAPVRHSAPSRYTAMLRLPEARVFPPLRQDHLEGKQYLGWKAIRDKHTELETKYAGQAVLPGPPVISTMGRPDAQPRSSERGPERSHDRHSSRHDNRSVLA